MKSFKKIIVPAIAAIALCLSLIAGATYAWFTDEAKTNVNTIQSGKLDVALEMKEGDGWVSAEGKTLSFLKMNAEGELVADENVLWEPGCTYKLPLLRVINNGNLAQPRCYTSLRTDRSHGSFRSQQQNAEKHICCFHTPDCSMRLATRCRSLALSTASICR